MISLNRMEKALTYLAETDEPYARVRALVAGLERQKTTIKAQAFRRAKDGPVSQKEAIATTSHEYQEHLKSIEVAEIEMFIMQNKRGTEHAVIDCWRSLNAARNKGQIV